jgi:transcription initiation factor TFIIB
MNCPHCEGVDCLENDTRNAQIVCTNCGIVLEESMIDDAPEWNYQPDEGKSRDPSRCGAPTMEFFEKSSMSTKIGGQGSNFMKKLHNQLGMDYVERARYNTFQIIEKWGKENGNLSDNVIYQAKQYYVKLSQTKITRGNIRKGLIACCIMYASKSFNVSRSVKEIANMCDLSVSIVNKAEKKFETIMKPYITSCYYNEHTNVNDLTTRFVNLIDSNVLKNISRFVIIKSVQTRFDNIKENPLLIGKTPSAITACLVHFELSSRSIKIDKKKISSLFNISNVTLNKISTIIKSI